ncbi:hypothetical protein [Pedobacter steynii]
MESYLGQEKAIFLIGAILSTLTLFFLPHSPVLWIAAGCLWVLDASINISMEPFRALVADKLPESQRSYGFVMQTLIIGVGTWIASNLPWLVNKLGVSNVAEPGIVPLSIKIAFAIGGAVFLLSILYTIFTTSEYPPDDLVALKKSNNESKGFLNGVKEIFQGISNMPRTMMLLGIIQFFSWFAFFAMWSLATPALTDHVFKAPLPIEQAYNMSNEASKTLFVEASKAYNNAADLVGSYMGMYGLSSMAFALILTLYAAKRDINRKYIHMLSLLAGVLDLYLCTLFKILNS